MKRLILIVIMLACLLGCSKPPLHNTRVLDKQYEPARSTLIMMPMMVGKVMIMIPVMLYDDEDYVLNVMGYTETGERKCRRIYVSKEQYDVIYVGDSVDALTMQYKDEHRKERR